MRGPRVRVCGASFPSGFVDDSAGAPTSLDGVEPEAASWPFAGVETGVRFRPGRLRGRTVSPST